MKKISILFLLWMVSGGANAGLSCDLVYDEFDSLMNKDFLTRPDQFVKVKKNRLSRRDFNRYQKGKFTLSKGRQQLGVAIIHTNRNTWGKLLYTWGVSPQNRRPILLIREAVLFGRVTDGYRPRVMKNIIISSSGTYDLDGRTRGALRRISGFTMSMAEKCIWKRSMALN